MSSPFHQLKLSVPSIVGRDEFQRQLHDLIHLVTARFGWEEAPLLQRAAQRFREEIVGRL